MNHRKIALFSFTSVLSGILLVQPALATRTIRADESMNELSTIGEEWGNATSFFDVPSDGTGWLDKVTLPDQIDIGAGLQTYVACFSDNGFVSLYADTTCGGDNGIVPNPNNEITSGIFDAGTDGVSDNWKTGIVIPGFPGQTTQYDALAFTWNFSTQLIFLILPNGDFNIEYNYNLPLPADSSGQQVFNFNGVSITANAPSTDSDLTKQEDICFRSGEVATCTVSPVPEPSSWLMVLAGLLTLFGVYGLANRKRCRVR
jgi:hypothetical protein